MDAISYSYADKQAKRINKFIENPDSNSGIVTVPKVIGAGESVTIPAGRVAVLPNVQVDGTLNVEGEVFIPSGATLSKVVELEGDQTISDTKTFLESPIVPTPTTGTQAVNKTYADTKITLATANSYDIGVGQTWQNVTASRAFGVTYTNTTGKPIVLMISFIGIGYSNWSYININGNGSIYWTNIYATGAGGDSIVIPHGSTYEVTSGGTGVNLLHWYELR